MEAVYIDDLALLDITDDTLKRTMSFPIQGLEAPALRVSSFLRSGDDGNKIVSSYRGERRINLEGYINKPTDCADMVTLRKQLSTALMPVRDSDGILTLKTLRLTANDGNTYQIQGTVISFSMPIIHPTNAKYAIDFLAEDSVIENYNQSTQLITVRSGGGAVLPWILPIVLDAGQGGSTIITNNGNESAYPIITFDGPLTNPRIQNTTTNAWIQLALTINLGEQVVVDMKNRTIIQDTTTNQLSTKTSDSTFWYLASGDNEIQLTTSVSGQSGTASVVWRDAWSGI